MTRTEATVPCPLAGGPIWNMMHAFSGYNIIFFICLFKFSYVSIAYIIQGEWE